jgi:molybdopterin converting factor small subunit
MDVRVRFFAMLRDAAGRDECWLVLGPGARGADAKTALVERYPRLAGLIAYARLAVNQEYQPWEAPLADGDELGLIPPVSGG